MNQQPNAVKRTSRLSFLFFILLATIIACNDKPNASSQTDTPAPDSATTPPVAPAAAVMNEFPVLCINKAEIETFYSAGVFKLVFNLTWDDTKNLNPTLTVYKSRQNGQFIGGAVKTLDTYNDLWPIQGISFLGNLELTKKYYYDTLEPKAEGKQSLLFYPVKSGDNGQRITYKLIWGDCNSLPKKADVQLLFAAADQLNPCPPNQPGQ